METMKSEYCLYHRLTTFMASPIEWRQSRALTIGILANIFTRVCAVTEFGGLSKKRLILYIGCLYSWQLKQKTVIIIITMVWRLQTRKEPCKKCCIQLSCDNSIQNSTYLYYAQPSFNLREKLPSQQLFFLTSMDS